MRARRATAFGRVRQRFGWVRPRRAVSDPPIPPTIGGGGLADGRLPAPGRNSYQQGDTGP